MKQNGKSAGAVSDAKFPALAIPDTRQVFPNALMHASRQVIIF